MSRDRGIPISPKHGVNPALVTCFWCGEETGEIALMGKLPDDAEAPKHVCLSYEPCKACKEHFKAGTLLVEVSTKPTNCGIPEIQEGCWPTGRWSVIKPEAFTRIFNEEKAPEKALIDKEAYSRLFGGVQ